jgi:hypothetical protein
VWLVCLLRATLLNHVLAQGNSIAADAEPTWATLQPWLRLQQHPKENALLVVLDNAEELLCYSGDRQVRTELTVCSNECDRSITDGCWHPWSTFSVAWPLRALQARKEAEDLFTALSGASRALHMAVVSRNADFSPDGAAVYRVEAMPLGEATELLCRACPGREIAQADAEQLAIACGRNPLELVLVGGILKARRDRSPQVGMATAP